MEYFVPLGGKLQKSLSLFKGVKQGYLVVVATEGWKPERFVVKLGYLNNPEFLKLLKQAEEEFGFSHEGALSIPCQPDDLERIIGLRRSKREEEWKDHLLCAYAFFGSLCIHYFFSCVSF